MNNKIGGHNGPCNIYGKSPNCRKASKWNKKKCKLVKGRCKNIKCPSIIPRKWQDCNKINNCIWIAKKGCYDIDSFKLDFTGEKPSNVKKKDKKKMPTSGIYINGFTGIENLKFYKCPTLKLKILTIGEDTKDKISSNKSSTYYSITKYINLVKSQPIMIFTKNPHIFLPRNNITIHPLGIDLSIYLNHPLFLLYQKLESGKKSTRLQKGFHYLINLFVGAKNIYREILDLFFNFCFGNNLILIYPTIYKFFEIININIDFKSINLTRFILKKIINRLQNILKINNLVDIIKNCFLKNTIHIKTRSINRIIDNFTTSYLYTVNGINKGLYILNTIFSLPNNKYYNILIYEDGKDILQTQSFLDQVLANIRLEILSKKLSYYQKNRSLIINNRLLF